MSNPLGSQAISMSTLYDQYHGRIFGYTLKLVGNPAEAEDLTQETFLRAYRQLATLTNPDAVGAWLYRIATNMCYDRFRQASFRIKVVSFNEFEEGAAALEDSESDNLGKVIDQDEMSACVQRYINRLSDDYRSAILFHDLHGMTCSEIANMLGISLETVKIRLIRARLKLKVILTAGCHISLDQDGVLSCDPKHPVK